MHDSYEDDVLVHPCLGSTRRPSEYLLTTEINFDFTPKDGDRMSKSGTAFITMPLSQAIGMVAVGWTAWGTKLFERDCTLYIKEGTRIWDLVDLSEAMVRQENELLGKRSLRDHVLLKCYLAKTDPTCLSCVLEEDK